MKFIQEFREFAVKGNVVDLAVGVIIGSAFGKIVTSFVNDILMPPLGLLAGGVNFTDLKIVLQKATGEDPAVTFNYGNFLQSTVDFIIISFAIFMFVKTISRMRRKEKAQPDTQSPSNEEKLLSEIRDILKNKA